LAIALRFLRAARTIGVNLPVLEAVVPKAESAEEHGLGNRDYIVLALDRAELQLSPQ